LAKRTRYQYGSVEINKRVTGPEWGGAYLGDARPALVPHWLRRLVLSPKYKGHIRSLMYRLFDKVVLWEWLNVECTAFLRPVRDLARGGAST